MKHHKTFTYKGQLYTNILQNMMPSVAQIICCFFPKWHQLRIDTTSAAASTCDASFCMFGNFKIVAKKLELWRHVKTNLVWMGLVPVVEPVRNKHKRIQELINMFIIDGKVLKWVKTTNCVSFLKQEFNREELADLFVATMKFRLQRKELFTHRWVAEVCLHALPSMQVCVEWIRD